MRRHPSGGSAFTLLELLVVVSIIALLTGMLTSMVGVARRKSMQTATMAIMAKVDAGIRTFRNEMRVYPRQTDLSTADVDPTKWTNNLGFRLAWAPATAAAAAAYAAKLQADTVAVHNAFWFVDGTKVGMGAPPNYDGTHVFRSPNPYVAGYVTNILLGLGSLNQPNANFTGVNAGAHNYVPSAGSATAVSQVLSSLAEEQCVLKLMSGQVPVLAPCGIDPNVAADKADFPNEDARYTMLHYAGGSPTVTFSAYNYVPYNRGSDARGPVLSAAAAQSQGFRGDYLSDTIKRQLDPTGDTVLDAWGHPLVYVCDLDPRMLGFFNALANGVYGDARRYGMSGSERRPATAMASDIRTTAAPAFQGEFELWSAGPDGLFTNMRDAGANRDNIPYLPYTRGLP